MLPAGESPLTVDVQGDYLYGAPAAGNRLLASFTGQAGPLCACRQQWPGFIFGDVADDTRRSIARNCRNRSWMTRAAGAIDVDLSGQKAASPAAGTGVRQPAGIRRAARWCAPSSALGLARADKLIAVRPLFDGDVARGKHAGGLRSGAR